MDIVFFGSGAFGIPCLDALDQSQHSLKLIVSQPPHPAGRGRKPTPTPVIQWADSQGLPFMETADVNVTDAVKTIADCHPDVIVVIAFGQKIGTPLINLPPKGMVNVHASVLPELRGAAPINWAILKGHETTGVSIITLADKIDAGDVLASSATPIGLDETAGQLHDRLAEFSVPVLLDSLRQIEAGTAVYSPQDHVNATFAPKMKKSDGFVDFTQPSTSIANRVRAFWPWPGASASYVSSVTGKSTRLVLAKVEDLWGDAPGAEPGTFDADLNIGCGQGRLKIVELKPAGSPLMGFRDFVNGRKTVPGDKLVSLVRDSYA